MFCRYVRKATGPRSTWNPEFQTVRNCLPTYLMYILKKNWLLPFKYLIKIWKGCFRLLKTFFIDTREQAFLAWCITGFLCNIDKHNKNKITSRSLLQYLVHFFQLAKQGNGIWKCCVPTLSADSRVFFTKEEYQEKHFPRKWGICSSANYVSVFKFPMDLKSLFNFTCSLMFHYSAKP